MEQENQSFVTEFVFIGLSSEPRVQTCLFAVFLVFYLLSVVGNILIIAVIRADPRLHMPMYFFLSHLSFLDICYITTNVPQLLVNLSTKSRTISFRACATQMYFSLACGMNECFLLGVMAYDRYVAICHPLRYTVIMNRKLCTQMVAVCWSCSLLSCLVVSALTLRLPFCGPNTLNHYFCEVPAMLALACADTSLTEKVVFIFSILIVFLPFVLIVLSYGRILSAIVWMKYDSSRAKAFSTCGSHLAVVALFYGTATIMYTRPQVKSSQDRNKIIALFYTIITPMLNPMIYSLRNKDVKGALNIHLVWWTLQGQFFKPFS
ncbi:olfactory receptor 2G3-like [Carettochelys insculpta]|uniref:olfactory receptor 2G3-like n=1 Tax=Carettochelys insculpta TaxID=44489 RepID=UPI003EC0FF5D